MRTSWLLSVVAVSALVVACDRSPTQVKTASVTPQAEMIQNDWAPFEFDYWTCTGAVVHFVGQTHVVYTQDYDWETETYRYRLHFNMHGTATGPDGSQYLVKQSEMQGINDPLMPGFEYTYKYQVKATGKGPLANEVYQLVYHVTINANGEATSSVDKSNSDCKVKDQASTLTPQAALLTNEWLTFGSYLDVCGEYVQFNGKYHMLYDFSADPETGKYHYRYHINAEGTGTGASGATYLWRDNINDEQNVSGPGTEWTSNRAMKLIGKGPADNQVIHTLWHMTINANGELTAEVEKLTSECH